MWVFIQEPKGGWSIQGPESGVAFWGLVPGSSYTVGREGKADIEGVGKDVSVSKLHAKLSVGPPVKEGRPEVTLEDIGSKFGTHLNSGILSESQRLAATASGRISK